MKKVLPKKIQEFENYQKEGQIIDFDSNDLSTVKKRGPEPSYRTSGLDYSQRHSPELASDKKLRKEKFDQGLMKFEV